MSFTSLGNSTFFALFLKWPLLTSLIIAGILAFSNNVDSIKLIISNDDSYQHGQKMLNKPIIQISNKE